MVFNITLIGQTGSGKTELVKKLCAPGFPFDQHYVATHDVEVKSSSDKKLKFIDTGGQERFQVRLDSCIGQADAVLICVDLSQTLDEVAIQAQIDHVKKINPNAHLIMVGTKTDLNHLPIDLSQFSLNKLMVSSKENKHIDALKERLLTLSQERQRTRDLANVCFNQALSNLQTALQHSPHAKKKKILAQVTQLQRALNQLHGTQDERKTALIADFVMNCEKILDQQHPKVLKAILSFAIALFVGTLIAAVGFGIGCAVGAWIPVFFIASIKTASTGAIGLIAASGASAAISGGLAAHALFKKPASVVQEKKAIQDFSKKL